MKINVVYSDYILYLCCMNKKRELFFYKNYFKDFYRTVSKKAQRKIIWTFKIIEELNRIPKIYFKHIEGTNGLYEIRVQVGNNIYRIFCFFNKENLVVVGHGFHKKTQKIPKKEIERAIQIKNEYYEERKKSYKP